MAKKQIFDSLDFKILMAINAGIDSQSSITELIFLKEPVTAKTVWNRLQKILETGLIEVQNKKYPENRRKYKLTEKAESKVRSLNFLINLI